MGPQLHVAEVSGQEATEGLGRLVEHVLLHGRQSVDPTSQGVSAVHAGRPGRTPSATQGGVMPDDAEDAEDPAEADEPPLSDRLEAWLTSDHPKTVGDLIDTFGAQSFALLFVVLMAFPALPLPTGGLSHVLEILTMLLALEMVAGRREVWVPKRWQRRELKGVSGPRFRQLLLKRIRWFERFSRPRWSHLLELRATGMALGLVVLVLALAAFLSPPFSGLDTLPSLGVVVLGLGILFGDAAIAAIGAGIGAVGIVVVIGLGSVIFQLV